MLRAADSGWRMRNELVIGDRILCPAERFLLPTGWQGRAFGFLQASRCGGRAYMHYRQLSMIEYLHARKHTNIVCSAGCSQLMLGLKTWQT